MKKLLKTPVVVDLRNVYRPADMRRRGIALYKHRASLILRFTRQATGPILARADARGSMAKASSLLENRALVSGGSGFLGSHLCDRLIDARAGCPVRRQPVHRDQKRNIDHLHDNPQTSSSCATMYLSRSMSRSTRSRTSPASASPIHYQHDPVQTTKTSVHWRDQHAGPRQATSAPSILQASTSEVYGRPAMHPQTEDYWGNG